MYYFPTSLIESDVALAYLPSASVTIAVVDMIMSLVLDYENKKQILRPMNLVHKVEFNDNEGL